jgi:hypothetical protein
MVEANKNQSANAPKEVKQNVFAKSLVLQLEY